MPGGTEIVGAALGAAQTVEGLINAGKTKKIANTLSKTRPQLGRDALADENLALTKSELAQGMSAKAEKAYGDIADRDFSASLSAILKGGGNLNSIGDIYGSKEEGRQKLAIMRDNLRMSQISNEINASKAVSERNDQQFLFNVDAPWKDASRANAQAREKAQQQIWGGLSTIGSAGMSFLGGKADAKQLGLKDPSELSGTQDYNDILGLSTAPQPEPIAQRQPLRTTINDDPWASMEATGNYTLPSSVWAH